MEKYLNIEIIASSDVPKGKAVFVPSVIARKVSRSGNMTNEDARKCYVVDLPENKNIATYDTIKLASLCTPSRVR